MTSLLRTTILIMTLFCCFTVINLKATPLDDFQQQLANHKGKVVYVDFWASWCTPCRQAFPWLNQMHAQYKDKGLIILAVNVDYDKSLAERFLQEVPADFSIFYDSKGKVARSYKLKGMPSSLLINREGQIIKRHVGFKKENMAQYQANIEAALQQ